MLKNTLTMVISKDGEEWRGGEGLRRSGILPGEAFYLETREGL